MSNPPDVYQRCVCGCPWLMHYAKAPHFCWNRSKVECTCGVFQPMKIARHVDEIPGWLRVLRFLFGA